MCVDESAHLLLQCANEYERKQCLAPLMYLMVRGLRAGLCTPPGGRDGSRGEAPVSIPPKLRRPRMAELLTEVRAEPGSQMPRMLCCTTGSQLEQCFTPRDKQPPVCSTYCPAR